MADSITGFNHWRLSNDREQYPFEALCEEWRYGAFKHQGATLVHTTSREEWERHLCEEHPKGLKGGHMAASTRATEYADTPVKPIPKSVRLTEKEKDLLGKWVTTPDGRHGQIWCMADRHNSRCHGSIYGYADVWIVITVTGEHGSVNVLQSWHSEKLTVHGTDRGVLPEGLF